LVPLVLIPAALTCADPVNVPCPLFRVEGFVVRYVYRSRLSVCLRVGSLCAVLLFAWLLYVGFPASAALTLALAITAVSAGLVVIVWVLVRLHG
jgi:hypothetical protein